METTLTNVNAYENAVRTQAGAADIRAQLLDSLAKSKAVVDSVFGKIEEIDRMKAESEQLRKKISTVIPGKATMLTMLSVLSLLVFGLFGAPVVLSIFRVTDPGTIYLTFILVPTVPFVSILLIRSRVVKEASRRTLCAMRICWTAESRQTSVRSQRFWNLTAASTRRTTFLRITSIRRLSPCSSITSGTDRLTA